ncbi:hypothetical protein K439DRAFT_1032550 [Ramaria rubella]|nr:hypothetical protein K439DRAFT_1032550 [Ramaria rubella]
MVSFVSVLLLFISVGSVLSIPVPKAGAALGSQRVSRDEFPEVDGGSPINDETLGAPSGGLYFAGLISDM